MSGDDVRNAPAPNLTRSIGTAAVAREVQASLFSILFSGLLFIKTTSNLTKYERRRNKFPIIANIYMYKSFYIYHTNTLKIL